ncbi:MAG TPA: hypothetical protein VJ651_07050 [Noviherbaspirillum sp.]|nr:hypothetical protein [Noviherbaspirillum sp.]HJV80576.1 hypothetical protein [Noviherbaspirillum sp.]
MKRLPRCQSEFFGSAFIGAHAAAGLARRCEDGLAVDGELQGGSFDAMTNEDDVAVIAIANQVLAIRQLQSSAGLQTV